MTDKKRNSRSFIIDFIYSL